MRISWRTEWQLTQVAIETRQLVEPLVVADAHADLMGSNLHHSRLAARRQGERLVELHATPLRWLHVHGEEMNLPRGKGRM